MKRFLKKIFRATGYDITGFSPKFHASARKPYLLKSMGLDVFFDIGANQGQFATWLRMNGWVGKIHSFEPGSQAFSELKLKTDRDRKWEAHQLAIGSRQGNLDLHVSKDLFSSSLKTPTDINIGTCPAVKTDFSEMVIVKTLDQIVEEILPNAGAIAVKIDVQGHESEVLEGASMALRHCKLLILELSLKELSHDQKLLHEILPLLYSHGFYLSVMEPCHEDFSNLEILQLDAWFLKRA
jgi:FkbM family methyltransferase